jgi:hypothetical protein
MVGILQKDMCKILQDCKKIFDIFWNIGKECGEDAQQQTSRNGGGGGGWLQENYENHEAVNDLEQPIW